MLFSATDLVVTPSPNAPAGFVQRISIIIGWGWISVFAVRLLSTKPPVDR